MFPHYDSAKKLLRYRNSDHYREPQQRFTKPQTGLHTIRARTVITDFETAAMRAISQMLSIVSFLSTSANLGGAESRPLVCQETIDKNSAISKWLVLLFELSLLPSDEVGTAFANEIMSIIPDDDRCRKFASYIVDHYIDSGCYFAPDLWASSSQQSLTNATESLHADYTRGELDQLGYIRCVGYRFAS